MIRWGYIHEKRPCDKSNPIRLNRCFWAITSCPWRTRGNWDLNGAGLRPSLSGAFNGGHFCRRNDQREKKKKTGETWLENKAGKQVGWPQLHAQPSSSGFAWVRTAPADMHLHRPLFTLATHTCTHTHTDVITLRMQALAKRLMKLKSIRAALCQLADLFLIETHLKHIVKCRWFYILIVIEFLGKIFVIYDILFSPDRQNKCWQYKCERLSGMPGLGAWRTGVIGELVQSLHIAP